MVSDEAIIAGEWIHQDFDSAVSWFVDKGERDLSEPYHLQEVATLFHRLPDHRIGNAYDWITKRHAQGKPTKELILKLEGYRSYRKLAPEIETIVTLLPEAEDRIKYVSSFIGPTGKDWLNHPPEKLISLVEAAELPENRVAMLKDQIASRTWKPPIASPMLGLSE